MLGIVNTVGMGMAKITSVEYSKGEAGEAAPRTAQEAAGLGPGKGRTDLRE